jgi:putative CocE/NonD family hydrolase
MRVLLGVVLILLSAAVAYQAAASDLEFRAPASADDAKGALQDLAGRLVPVYQDPDPDRYLANLSALQMVAGNYDAADESRRSLRERRRRPGGAAPVGAQLGPPSSSPRPLGRDIIFDIYAHALAAEADGQIGFPDAFAKSYREAVARLSDLDAYNVNERFRASPTLYRDAFQKLLDQQRASDSIAEPAAFDLFWAYLYYDAYRSFAASIGPLTTEDDARRYEVIDDIQIKTRDGDTIAAVSVRPRSAAKPLPTLLEYTIYGSSNHAKECAARGYVGVVAYVPGVHGSTAPVVPYQHDGEDALNVINWIAKQPWSDGHVGMYGEGYSGFAAWAAAKHLPAALRAIATSAPSAPGVDVPMTGNIFQNSAYRWSLYVTDKNADDEKDYYDDELWHALNQKWYRGGGRYRDFGRIYGKPNPLFIRWLNHPSYDRFWQEMIPYQKQFAKINIPVLTMTGYYAGSQPAALYYFTQHHRFNPHADHTLFIGPFDDAVMQRGPLATLQAYSVDPVALIDVRALRYQWFDHVFKAGAMPAVLSARVNFEVMGANEWRHAASIETMAKGTVRYYLDPAAFRDGHHLSQHKIAHPGFVLQTVNLRSRKDAAWVPSLDLISKSLAPHNHVLYESAPLPTATELNGPFSARLDFTVNKMDVDLNVILYEHMANGDYIRLFSPTNEARASYAQDRAHRHLLKAGERQTLIFRGERMTSRRLEAGSRLVVILGISKRPDREINYGMGDDVSEESMADGAAPIKIRWYSDGYFDVPMGR